MATKPESYVTLDAELIAEVWAWACNCRIKNRFTTHGAEDKPELQATSRLCEHAFAKSVGLQRSAVNLGSVAFHDVTVGDRLVEVRSCEMFKRFLCWPATKTSEYFNRNFTDLALVKFELMPIVRFQISGWVSKQRFYREKFIAPDGPGYKLDDGTWYMRDDALDHMDTFKIREPQCQ